jgi:uncharacterized protein YjbI with pentapeptide repeats
MKPNQPKLLSPLEEGNVALLKPESSIESRLFEDQEATGLTADNMKFDEVRLSSISLVGARLSKLTASDVVANNCDFTAADMAESSFTRVQFEGARMAGSDLNKSLLEDAVFKGCKLDMANFRFATLKRVKFVDCALIETDFLGARLTQVHFENCQLEKTEFSQCKVSQLDLRSSQLIEVSGWQDLKGAIIDEVQLAAIAPSLAASVGLIIGD